MRKELLGPIPLVLGILLIASAFLFAPRPPPLGCDCPLYTAAGFEAEDRAGYPHVARGTTIFVDGRVADVTPSLLLDLPYRYVRFEGSSIVFNVTAYDLITGPVGEWTRIAVVHDGQNEGAGPDSGHRWTQVGRTAPPGGEVAAVAELALGLAVAAWGVATWKRFGAARTLDRSQRERLGKAKAAVASDPAAQVAVGLANSLGAVRKQLRYGQYDAAGATLDEIEVQVARAVSLGVRLNEARSTLERESAQGFNAKPALEILKNAEAARSEGNVPGSEGLLEEAHANIREIGRAREMISMALSSVETNRARGVEDPAAEGALEVAREQMAAGLAKEALARATESVDRSRESSPGARAAAAEIEALKELLRAAPAMDRSREVRDRVRDAEVAYHLGQLDRARAEARVGIWLVDPGALTHEAFGRLVESRFVQEGFAILPTDPATPPIGFLAGKGGERVLVVTVSWREFPSERVLMAAKDFVRSGGAEHAVMYSSVFTNTSTDTRVEVVDIRKLVELLRQAALDEVARSS